MADLTKGASTAIEVQPDVPRARDVDDKPAWQPFEANTEKAASLNKTDVNVLEGPQDSKQEDEDVVYVKGHPVIRNGKRIFTLSIMPLVSPC